MKKLLSFFMMVLFLGIINAQTVTIYTENVGIPTGTTLIQDYTGWSNTKPGITYIGDGTCDVRITSVSSGYPTASGNGNVMINNTTKWFQVSGISTFGYENITLSFGLRKSTTADNGTAFTVQYSTDNSTWHPLSFPALPTGTGTAIWHYVTITENLPAVNELHLRFSSTNSVDYRLDDILIQGGEEPGDECALFEDIEHSAWATTGNSGSYANRTITDALGSWSVSAVTAMTAGSDRFNGLRSARFRGNTSDTGDALNKVEMLFNNPNGIGTVSFVYGSFSTHSGGVINLEYSIDNGVTWIHVGSKTAPSWTAGGSVMQEASFNVDIPGNARIRITKNPQSGSTSINIDDICITDFTATNTVATPTFTPPGGNYITSQNVTISTTTGDAIIYYTTNGDEPTEASFVYSGAIPVNATTTIKAIATKAGMANSSVNSVTYTFPVEVANIAAFKAANTVTNSTWYKITGNITFVYRNGRNIYVKDATGGLLIFDETTPVVTTAYSNGDVISGGVIGTYTLFNGLSELIPKANTAAGVAGTPVEPITLTMANLLANFDDYESQLVKLEEVSFDAGTFGTGANANINIYQGSNEMICRNHFGTFTGFTPGATKRFNVAGFAIPFNTDRQIAPRDSITDITEVKYTVTVSASPVVGGTVSGDGLYSYNENVTIIATPNVAYNFINWTEGVTTVSTNEQYTFAITEDRTFVANFQMKTYTISASVNGGNGTIAPIGDSTVNYGATVVYTITPNTNYEIDQVLINGTNNPGAVSSGSYTFENITANHTIVASFKIKTYNVSVSANPTTGGSVSGGGTYNHNSEATVIATANASHNFVNWTESNIEVSDQATYTFTVTGARTLVANFAIKTYTVTATAGANGTISPAGDSLVNHGAAINFTITPNSGYHILSIIVDGEPVSYTVNPEVTASHPYTFSSVVTNHTIEATFALNCYTSTIAAPNVTVTSTPTCVAHGSDVTYTFTPGFCHNITGVTINGNPVTLDENNQFTLTNVTAKPNIVVTTAIKVFTITATPLSDPWGSITPSGVVNVNCGGSHTFHFAAEEGYRIKTLLINGESKPIPLDKQYIFTNITANQTIHLEFEEFPYYIIQFGPNKSQQAQTGGFVYPQYEPDAVNYVAVDSATAVYPFIIQAIPGFEIDQVLVDGKVNTAAAQTGYYEFLNVKAHHTIFATFKPILYTITATAGVGGVITPNGAVQVIQGTNQIFLAVPNWGYELGVIKVDGEIDTEASETGIYEFKNVQTNHTISAEFVKIKYEITATVDGGNGTITPGTIEIEHGNNQTFTFIPNPGYKVNQVFVDGVLNLAAIQAGSYTFTNVIQPHTIKVTFTELTFTIIATTTVGGSIEPSGIATITYDHHSEIYVIDPEIGYRIQSVLIDGVNDFEAVENAMYRFLNVKANHTIHVIFVPQNFTIVASTSQGGLINPVGLVTVPRGGDKEFIFEALAGFELVRVLVNGIDDEEAVATGRYTFTNVLANQTIAAQFERRDYTVILPDMEGVMVIPVGGSSSPVEAGGKFAFIVQLVEGYTQSNIIVRANNVVLNPIGGVYTINNIVIDQVVTISGVKLNEYLVVAKAHAGGAISPEGTFMIAHGDNKTFEITPNANFRVREIRVNGVATGETGPFYTLAHVTANATVEVYFEPAIGINENQEPVINIFSYNNIVTIVNEELVPIKQVEVMDMYGRVIWKGQATGDRTEITLNVAAGIYNVRVVTETNNVSTTKVSIN